jgi:hypothetical protein
MQAKPSPKAAGGNARALSLTAEERSAIARKGAYKKAGFPTATHAGTVTFGDVPLPCYVLEDGRRVLTTRGMMAALGRTWRGRKYAGTRLPVFLEAKNLFPFIINELDPVLAPLDFVTDKGVKAEGYEASLLPMVCEVYLQARQAGVISQDAQLEVAQRCEMLVRSLAKIGITALIDEATGYQQVRERVALQALLDKYLLQEHAAWAKRFPDDFYRQMFRLKNWEFPTPSGARPGVVGKYTLDIVYERLAPGLVDELKERNPKGETGHRKTKHHQWLTDDVGHPALTNHIHAVMGLMRASKSWEMFKGLLDDAFPKKGTQFRLAIEE